MENKKILFLIQLPPPVHGVSTINQLIIQNHYIRNNIDMDILPINTSKKFEEIDRLSLRKVIRGFRILIVLLKRILTNKYCFVYFTINIRSYAFYRDIIYAFILRLFSLKRVYNLQGYGVSVNATNLFKRTIYKWYFDKAKVITLSNNIYKDICNFVKDNNKFILHNALPITVQDNIIEFIINKRRDRGTFNILFLSNLMESKGPEVLLQTLTMLRDRGYNFRAYFAGAWVNDNYRNFFLGLIRSYRLNEYVEIMGFCSTKNKLKVFSNSDIFVLPTLKDASPLVILEAMEYALPIISTDEGAIPEIINDGVEGFIVPKKDANSLANKIEILINDKNLRLEMGKNARVKFIKNYSFIEYEKRFVEILNLV